MTNKSRFAALGAVVLLAISPALRAESSAKASKQASAEQDRNEVAIRAMASAMVHTETQLNDLLGEAPEKAKPVIQDAIATSRQSREQAIAALDHANVSADTKASVEANVSGTARARVAIDTGMERAQKDLKEAMVMADGASRAAIRDAIDVVRDGASSARAALDSLRPERVAADVTTGAKVGIELDRP